MNDDEKTQKTRNSAWKVKQQRRKLEKIKTFVELEE